MAGKAANRVNVNVTTKGTLSPLSCGLAIAGFDLLSAMCRNGDIVEYTVTDGVNAEVGWGIVGGSQDTITRNVWESTNAGAAIDLSGSATCIITLTAQGFQAMLSLATQRLAGGL